MAGSPKRAERRARFEAWIADPEDAMDELCEWIDERGEHGHLMGFSRFKDLPYTTLREWIEQDAGRVAVYARACELRNEAMAVSSLEIVDEDPGVNPQTGALDSAGVAWARTRADHRKWVLSKLSKRYADKVEIDATVRHDVVGELREFLSASRLPLKAGS